MESISTSKKSRLFKLDIKWVVILSAILLLLLIEVFPMIYLVIKSFFSGHAFSLKNYSSVYSKSSNWVAFANTFKLAFFSMILSLIISFPLAWLIGRTNLPGKKFFRTLFVTTYMIPPYVGAIAWSNLLNPSVGYMNVAIMKMFGLSKAPFNIYTFGGLVWVITLFYYPYAFITISRALEKMDPTLEEGARVSGASPLKTLFDVTIPLTYPSILSGGLLVFISAASAFGIPSIIGMPGKIQVLTTSIVSYVYTGQTEGLSQATALAVSLMITANVILYLTNIVFGGKEYITISGKSTQPNLVDLGKWKWFFLAIVIIFSVFAIFLPLFAVVITSLIKSLSKPISFSNLTLSMWVSALKDSTYISAFKNSLFVGVITATIATLVALLLAYFLVKTRVKGRRVPDYLITLGSATPSVVIALALILTFSGKFGINIYSTFAILIVAYIVKYLMMPMRTISSALTQVDSSLEEAALNSGANWLRSFKDILMPLVAPSIIAGWFLIFMPSFYELSMSILLYGSKTKTIGVLLYELQTYADQQSASVLSVMILIVVLIGNLITRKVSKGNVGI